MYSRIFKQLEKTQYGHLIINTPCGDTINIGDQNSPIHGDIQIHDWRVFDLVLSKGDIGFGEGYIKGLFTTNNLANLLSLIALNQKDLEPLFHSNIIYSAMFGLKNLLKKNTLKGSKKNIKHHYDIGNHFYSLWLDKTMSYSAGIFDKADCLWQAQSNKYQRVLSQLNQNTSQILEIGCGWGGLINEAHHQGYCVKGLTLSRAQQFYSEQLIKDNNINSQIAFQDYRLEKDKFDHIISIEMFEAVGRKYWDDYFSKIKECLNKDGRIVIQTITIDDALYHQYANTSDYIREYIFPGGFLPSELVFHQLAKKHGLHILDEFKFGESYTKTLLQWLDNFNQAQDKVLDLGYHQDFIRKWQFYLAYCAAGFHAKRTNVIQYSLTHA